MDVVAGRAGRRAALGSSGGWNRVWAAPSVRTIPAARGRAENSVASPTIQHTDSGPTKGQAMATDNGLLVRRPHLIPAAIAVMVLLGAMLRWPYAYYQFTRWIVCAAAVFVVCKGWTFKQPWAVLAFGFVAILFNPLFVIHLKRETWQVIDLLAATAFIAVAVALARPSPWTKNGGSGGLERPERIKEEVEDEEDAVKGQADHGAKAEAEFDSENTFIAKEDQEEYKEIMAQHATNPTFQWLDRSSRGYWGFASRVAGYFLESLHRVRSRNPFVGIARCMFVFVAAFIVVPPLYLVIGPVVQVALVIIAIVWMLGRRLR